MKRFLVFASHQYYPQGGMLDLAGMSDDIDEAKRLGEREWARLAASPSGCNDCQLLDLDNRLSEQFDGESWAPIDTDAAIAENQERDY